MPKPSPTEAILPPDTIVVDGSLSSARAWPAEARAAFHLRLRARGVRDLAVLRAFEIVPRGIFLPAGLATLATREMPLPLPWGQTSHEPWRCALAIEALAVEPTHRVLEIGAGSGYNTAILAQIAGEVLGVERWAGLAEAAQARLSDLGLTHAVVAWADGLVVADQIGRFDRILVHGTVPAVAAFDGLLAPGGRMVAGHGGRSVLRAGGETRDIGACPYAMLVGGLAGEPRT